MNQTEELEGLKVLADEPIQGPAAFVEERQGRDEEELAEELKAHVFDSGVAIPGARGPLDAFRRIVQSIRGRTLIEDLGMHEFTIDWLTFHVPPGGKGHLQMANTEGSEFGIRLSLIGLGFGSGHRITLSVKQDFRERTNCLQLSQRVQAQVLAYAVGDSRKPAHLQLNVLKVLACQATALKECTDCFSTDAENASLIEQAGSAIDLTHDPVGQIREEMISLEDDSEREIGLSLSLAGMEIKPSVAVNRSIHLDCEISYEFPGSYCFTPFRKLDGWEDLPFWRRT